MRKLASPSNTDSSFFPISSDSIEMLKHSDEWEKQTSCFGKQYSELYFSQGKKNS
jgi:hypothetical protein